MTKIELKVVIEVDYDDDEVNQQELRRLPRSVRNDAELCLERSFDAETFSVYVPEGFTLYLADVSLLSNQG